MRLRHIKRAKEFLDSHQEIVVTNLETINIEQLFQNDLPLHLEIGCGKGQFIINMAKSLPNINFIAIEKYDSVLLRAVEKYLNLEEKPSNLFFILGDFKDIEPKIKTASISNIYLNFSDPWPKQAQAKRRLTANNFLNSYKRILTNDGTIIQKTDNVDLFNYSLLRYEEENFTILEKTYDLHNTNIKNITTEFEDKWSQVGPICYVKVKK